MAPAAWGQDSYSDLRLEPWQDFNSYDPIPDPDSVNLPAYDESSYQDFGTIEGPDETDTPYSERFWRDYRNFNPYNQSEYQPYELESLPGFLSYDPYDPMD